MMAGDTGIDAAVMSKIERGLRTATRSQVKLLADCLDIDLDDLLDLWLSEKIVDQLKGEENALKALHLAEDGLSYNTTENLSISNIKLLLKRTLSSDQRILMAWIFGSYARSENINSSDIDIMISVDESSSFSIFDLADIQYKCQQSTSKKIDIVVEGSLKPTVKDSVNSNLIPIYEK